MWESLRIEIPAEGMNRHAVAPFDNFFYAGAIFKFL